MAFWDNIGSSGDVEDRRGQRSTIAIGGGLTGLLLMAAFVLLSGGSGTDVLNTVLEQAANQTTTQSTDQPFEDPSNYQGFASKVLGSTNDTWKDVLQSEQVNYTGPKLVLFREVVQTGCGVASSAVGPFYCPSDQTIYLDETFFDAIKTQLGATTSGDDVAQAYVIAHEVGHHVQNVLGTMDQVDQSDPATSVRLELQADCYAGIWAHNVRQLGVFENDQEINEALGLASAIGDDRIQEKTQGQVSPETWTHGSSDQRVKWFKAGYETGTLESCQTL